MELTRGEMMSALFANIIQRQADEQDLTIRDVIERREEFGEEDIQLRHQIYREGTCVLRDYAISWSDEYCSQHIPEDDYWATAYGAPSYCAAFCLVEVAKLMGEPLYKFAFFVPSAYQERERQRWHKIEQLLLLNMPGSASLQIPLTDGGLIVVDALAERCCMLRHLDGVSPTSTRAGFVGSRYAVAEEMMALELELGREFESQRDID
jgi:hypothetical protein